MGLGAQLTFGNNSGQLNFGLYSGVGEGVFIDYDPTDSGGCHINTRPGEVVAHGGIGLGDAVTVDDTIPFQGPPSLDVAVNLPGGGGISWSPDKPLEPPHGALGVGAGGFAGVGMHFYSIPSSECSCLKGLTE